MVGQCPTGHRSDHSRRRFDVLLDKDLFHPPRLQVHRRDGATVSASAVGLVAHVDEGEHARCSLRSGFAGFLLVAQDRYMALAAHDLRAKQQERGLQHEIIAEFSGELLQAVHIVPHLGRINHIIVVRYPDAEQRPLPGLRDIAESAVWPHRHPRSRGRRAQFAHNGREDRSHEPVFLDEALRARIAWRYVGLGAWPHHALLLLVLGDPSEWTSSTSQGLLQG
mmetsp:Transcript_51437/g.147476  ORF Transcript_51437/g.147476 Transcript_51437/m.147476 type:complete len:223 (+) Transcript_51437:1689-2357(+)